MKICFPVEKNEGTSSKVYGHFGSAPVFLIVNSDDGKLTVIDNKDLHHSHGMCHPLKAIDGQDVDAVVVGGMGRGALGKLKDANITVFQAQAETIEENVDLFKKGKLSEMSEPCGHAHGKGCE